LFPLATLYAAGVIYATYSVLGVGFALLLLVQKYRVLDPPDAVSRALTAVALGLCYNAIIFLVTFQMSRLGLLLAAAQVWWAKLACDSLVFCLIAWTLRDRAQLLASVGAIFTPSVLSFAVLGFVVGTWAFLRFPYVLDCPQLPPTQDLLWGLTPSNMGPGFGFSGLIYYLGAAFVDIPLVTVAAAFKPLLGVLLGIVALHATRALRLPCPPGSALLYFVLLLLSNFGLNGVIGWGKDSIYGVLFSIAFLVTLCREVYPARPFELSLYFAMASVLGVISVPYMLTAYGLWLLLADSDEGAWRTVAPMWFVNAVPFPIVLAEMSSISLKTAIGLYATLGIVLLSCAMAARSRIGLALTDHLRRLRESLGTALRSLPIILMAIAFVMLPVTLELVAWTNVDGSLRTGIFFPLDGKTGFVAYFLGYPFQKLTMTVGVLAAALLPWLRRNRGLLALTSMPLLVLVLALFRIKLKLEILKDSNIWDLIKDIPNWYGGALYTLFVVAALALCLQRVRIPALRIAFAIGASALLSFWPVFRYDLKGFAGPVQYTSTGGFSDSDMARVTEVIWKLPHHSNVLIDRDTNSGKYWLFYSLPMYGASPSVLTEQTLARMSGKTFYVIVDDQSLKNVTAYASSNKMIPKPMLDNLTDGQMMLEINPIGSEM
jgi:hypothetical protein